MTKVTLSLPEIYKKLCPKCKKVVEKLVEEKMTKQAIKEALEGKEGEQPE